MKVLVVDDEALARIEICSMIPWNEYGYNLIGEASCSKEALVLARLHKPDIIIADIVMPEMNGLDLIRKVKEELPLCKFVIISCMNNFEFYKEAMKLNVSDYIQKDNMNSQDLIQTLKRVADDIEKNRVY